MRSRRPAGTGRLNVARRFWLVCQSGATDAVHGAVKRVENHPLAAVRCGDGFVQLQRTRVCQSSSVCAPVTADAKLQRHGAVPVVGVVLGVQLHA